jgi:chitin disaccharide deacetylase
MPRRLIVNADDFARAPGVSRGILEAHDRGIVTSTSVMVNQPRVEEQLLAAQAYPRLGLGLHLVFTAWRPSCRRPANRVGG